MMLIMLMMVTIMMEVVKIEIGGDDNNDYNDAADGVMVVTMIRVVEGDISGGDDLSKTII